VAYASRQVIPARAVAAALVLLAMAARAEGLDVPTAAYRAAAAAGHVGTVAGRATEQPRRRAAAETPLSGFSVTLVPRSQELLGQLRGIADRARTDPEAYRRTAPDIVAVRRDIERALFEAGAGDLVKYGPVQADGRFELRDVPEGEWLLLALRPVFVDRPSPQPKPSEKEMFAPGRRISGYYAVAVWVREVSVSAGRETVVRLTDRNVWMTAIEEKPAPGAGR